VRQLLAQALNPRLLCDRLQILVMPAKCLSEPAPDFDEPVHVAKSRPSNTKFEALFQLRCAVHTDSVDRYSSGL
jgi:hypothetical protein